MCFRLLRFAVIPALIHVICVSSAATAADGVLRAGSSQVDITPPRLPISMVGSFTDRKAMSVNDPLYVRCLALDDGKSRLVMMTVDCCLVSRELFDEAKKQAAAATGIPTTHMLMSATHTHTAAPVIDMAQIRADPSYNKFLTERLIEAVRQAVARLEPARLGWGVGKLPGEVHNRRWKMKPGTIPASPLGVTTDQVRTNPGIGNPGLVEPAGPTDPDVMLLAATTPTGKPLALYCVYSLHYVGGIPANALSADYFGEFANQMRERLVGDEKNAAFTAMLANGTSGDINNVDVRNRTSTAKPLEQLRLVADRLADVAEKEFRTMKFHEQVLLQASETELDLKVRKPSAGEVRQAEETLASSDGKPANVVRDVYAGETLVLAKWPDEVRLKLQTLRIGELAIAAIPCEPFVEIGLELKRRSPRRPTFVVGLANGYNGYLPTPEHHSLGGYETWRSRWSYLEPQASTKIIDALLPLLKESR
jgi:hypothetical protein